MKCETKRTAKTLIFRLSHLQGVRLAQKLEALVLADNRFEIPATRHLGMYQYHLNISIISSILISL